MEKQMNKKSPAELITEEFLERTFVDINRQLPSNMDEFTRNSNKRRLLRAAILVRLAE